MRRKVTVRGRWEPVLAEPLNLKGDVLAARCVELPRAGRTGVHDVTVVNQRGERIAVFRGRSCTAKGRPAVGA